MSLNKLGEVFPAAAGAFFFFRQDRRYWDFLTGYEGAGGEAWKLS